MEEVEFQRQSQGPLSTERLFQAGDDLNWASVLSLPSEPPSLLVPLPCPCTAHFQMSPELTYHTADKPSSLKETPEALLLGADPAPRKQVSHFGFASRGAQKAAEDAVCFPTPEGTGGGGWRPRRTLAPPQPPRVCHRPCRSHAHCPACLPLGHFTSFTPRSSHLPGKPFLIPPS